MKNKCLLGLLIVLFCFIVVGCSGKDNKKESIIGIWKYPSYDLETDYIAYLEFKDDGSGNYSFKTLTDEKSKYFSYTIEDNEITIKFIDNVDLREFAEHFGAYLDRVKALKVTYDEFLVEDDILSLIRYGDPSYKIELKKSK